MRAAMLVIGMLALAACRGVDVPALVGVPDEAQGEWVYVEGTVDGQAFVVPPGARVTLDIAGRQVGGTAACNQYFGTIEVSGATISIGQLGQTEMACEEPRMAAEQTYLAGLAATRAIGVDGDLLVLTGFGLELRFARVEPVPAAALVGTVWELDTLIEGVAASSVAGAPATLALSDDGTFTAGTGCRELAGTWQANGDTVTTPNLSAEGDCPAELSRQDGHVVGVLEGGFTVAVDGDRLTITSSSDTTLGLGYRAAG